jgi:hypothetical protein
MYSNLLFINYKLQTWVSLRDEALSDDVALRSGKVTNRDGGRCTWQLRQTFDFLKWEQQKCPFQLYSFG